MNYCPSPDTLKDASIFFQENTSFDATCSVDIDSFTFNLYKNGDVNWNSEEECTSALQNLTFSQAVLSNDYVFCDYDVASPSVFALMTYFPTTTSSGETMQSRPDYCATEKQNSWVLENAYCESTDVTFCPVVERRHGTHQ